MSSRAYISDTLIHWTGREKSDAEAFRVLQAICEEEILRLSYCPNYVQPDFKQRSLMVCFTDIPLKHSREHCQLFGRFGVAFKKTSMIRYGANPALYTTGAHFERIKAVNGLLARMQDREKDREWRSEIEPYSFTEEETLALLEVSAFLQEYAYKNQDSRDYVTYYQREWRLSFSSLPFAGQNTPHLPGMSSFYVREEKTHEVFRFAPSDVEFIIVPWRYWLRARSLASRLGCKVMVYDLSVCA